MTILVCGSRHWEDASLIRAVLGRIWAEAGQPHMVIVHGAAPGADTLAARASKEWSHEAIGHPADWKKHGKAAGPIRNKEMLDKHPDISLVLAFTDDPTRRKDGKRPGTWGMIEMALERGIPVRVFSHRRQADDKQGGGA